MTLSTFLLAKNGIVHPASQTQQPRSRKRQQRGLKLNPKQCAELRTSSTTSANTTRQQASSPIAASVVNSSHPQARAANTPSPWVWSPDTHSAPAAYKLVVSCDRDHSLLHHPRVHHHKPLHPPAPPLPSVARSTARSSTTSSDSMPPSSTPLPAASKSLVL